MSEVIPSSGLLRAFVDARFAPEKYYKVLLYEKEWNSVSLLAIYNAINNAQVTKAWFPTSILLFFFINLLTFSDLEILLGMDQCLKAKFEAKPIFPKPLA